MADELNRLREEETTDTPTRQGAGGDAADLAETAQVMERAIARRQRISYLTRTLATAEVDEDNGPPTVVGTGCAVTIRYVGDEDIERFWVGEVDTRGEDISVITPSSPMGQALLGSSCGDTVTYRAPAGELAVEVVAIG